VRANAPRLAALVGRQIGVGHDDVLFVATLDPLDPGVFKAVHAQFAGATQYVTKLVRASVNRGKDKDIGDVVQETRTGTHITGVAVANTRAKKVVEAVVMQKAGIKNGAVAGPLIAPR